MNWRKIVDLFKGAFEEWKEDKVARLAAALSYYTIFSLAPLVLITLSIVKLVLDGDTAETLFLAQIQGLVGETGAEFFKQILTQDDETSTNIMATIIGFATLLFGASGVFGQLKDALNTVWEVEPDPGLGIMGFIRKRVLSFGMVLVIGFLLLASLLLSTALAGFSDVLGRMLGDAAILAQILSYIVSFAVVSLLFAMIFKILPDVEMEWRDVWIGAAFTAVLFAVGKLLIGLYLGNQAFGSTYGAAGSILVLLVWIFYSAQIMLFGAEFTQVYAKRFGSRFVPSDDFHWVEGADQAKRLGEDGGETERRGPVIVTQKADD